MKKSIFTYPNFGIFIQNEIENNTQFKRGDKKKLADAINVHPSHLSQIISGLRKLTDEQLFLLTDFLGLSELESDYVFLLYQISNTHNKKFKERLNKKYNQIKKRSLDLSERVEKDKILTDEEKSIFYSSWQYSAIRTCTSIGHGMTREEISERLNIDKKEVTEMLEFLVKAQLCKTSNGKYLHNVNRTHLEKTSPYLKQHHSNWRIKSIQKKDRPHESDLSFTAPLSLSLKDFQKIRESMVKMIQEVSDTVTQTEPEDIFCFNLDLFKI